MSGRKWIWFCLGILVGIFLFVSFIGFSFLMAFRGASGKFAKLPQGNAALLHIEGIITAGKSSFGFRGQQNAGSESLIRELDEAGDNPQYKAILLRINSPGGTAAAAQEIYEKLLAIKRNTGKKIVVSMGDVAASGAYYIASAADKIYADPATLTGSIGVIAELFNFHSLLQKLGVQPEILKAGKFKDMGNESRPMTPQEKKIFQTILDETHGEFIQDVARGRNLSGAVVRELADGRVYTGKQALPLRLVDTLGSLEDAEDGAAQLAGISGKLKVVDLDRKTFLDQLLQGAAMEKSPFQFLEDRLLFLLPVFPLIH